MKIELEFISCTERLPEESGRYLCIAHYPNRTPNSGLEIEYYSSKDNKFFGYGPIDLVVTHWAALPDLSKSSEEAEIETFACQLASDKEVKTSLEQHRRRDLFERVAVATSVLLIRIVWRIQHSNIDLAIFTILIWRSG